MAFPGGRGNGQKAPRYAANWRPTRERGVSEKVPLAICLFRTAALGEKDKEHSKAGGWERGAVGSPYTRDCVRGVLLVTRPHPSEPQLARQTVVQFLHPRESVGLGGGGEALLHTLYICSEAAFQDDVVAIVALSCKEKHWTFYKKKGQDTVTSLGGEGRA